MKVLLNNINTYQAQKQKFVHNKAVVSFEGGVPKLISGKSKFFNPLKNALNKYEELLAKGISKIFKAENFQKIVKKTEKAKADVIAHLSAVIALLVSGMYIYKTLKNDKLDPDKKTTLAINQGFVAALSTVLGYTFNGLALKKTDKFIDRFMTVNKNNPKIIKELKPETLKMCKTGMKNAAPLIIFGAVYRFIAPVFVTPIANAIGNKIQEKKHAKVA